MRFLEVASIVEHDIWINGAHLQMVRFLFESHASLPFDPAAIGPSKQFPDGEGEEPELDNIIWEVTFWLRSRDEPVIVSDISGHDWVEIYTSCDGGKQFLVITDEDG